MEVGVSCPPVAKTDFVRRQVHREEQDHREQEHGPDHQAKHRAHFASFRHERLATIAPWGRAVTGAPPEGEC